MPVSLIFLAGCNGGKDSICALMSGEALNSTQSSPLPLTVIEDCVLAFKLGLLALKPAQFSQLQIH